MTLGSIAQDIPAAWYSRIYAGSQLNFRDHVGHTEHLARADPDMRDVGRPQKGICSVCRANGARTLDLSRTDYRTFDGIGTYRQIPPKACFFGG